MFDIIIYLHNVVRRCWNHFRDLIEIRKLYGCNKCRIHSVLLAVKIYRLLFGYVRIQTISVSNGKLLFLLGLFHNNITC